MDLQRLWWLLIFVLGVAGLALSLVLKSPFPFFGAIAALPLVGGTVLLLDIRGIQAELERGQHEFAPDVETPSARDQGITMVRMGLGGGALVAFYILLDALLAKPTALIIGLVPVVITFAWIRPRLRRDFK